MLTGEQHNVVSSLEAVNLLIPGFIAEQFNHRNGM